jgi:hypothetical protein
MNITNNEINLLDIENQNISTSLELFDVLKQNVEEYCSFMRKYRECTSSYYDKLSKLTYNIKRENLVYFKNSNLSSIFCVLNKIPELIKLQLNGFKKFLSSYELTFKPLENVLKNEMNLLEDSKKMFEENKKKYVKNTMNNKRLMESLSITENKIVKYYLAKKKKKDYKEEKNSMIFHLKESKISENEYLEYTNGGENYHWLFHQDSMKTTEVIKSHLINLLENLNSRILFFLCLFNDCYSPSLNFIQGETNSINSNPINTIDIINETLPLKTFALEEMQSDKYNIKILDLISLDRVNYSIDVINVQNSSIFTNFWHFLTKDSGVRDKEIYDYLNKMDLLCIVKKLICNFKMINSKNYDVKSEEQKIKVKDLTDKLLLMKKHKNNKIKVEKITPEETKKLTDLLINNKENDEIFLNRLNKIRTYGDFEYDKETIKEITKILKIILNNIKGKQDYGLFQFSIILSQTFFYTENGNKEYLYKFVRSHKIFSSAEMWENLLESIINEKCEEFQQYEYSVEKKKDDEEKKKKKIMEIIFAQIISISHDMIDFDLDFEKAKSIVNSFINKYKLNESQKQIIMDMMVNKNSS